MQVSCNATVKNNTSKEILYVFGMWESEAYDILWNHQHKSKVDTKDANERKHLFLTKV